MRSLRLVPYWSVHETLGVDAHNAPLKMRTRRIHLSRAVAWSCVRRHPVAGAALGSTDVEGSDPPAGHAWIGIAEGWHVHAHATLRVGGSLPSISPYRKVVRAMRRPATLVLVGLASAVAVGHAAWPPFPASGGNPVLDLIASCAPPDSPIWDAASISPSAPSAAARAIPSSLTRYGKPPKASGTEPREATDAEAGPATLTATTLRRTSRSREPRWTTQPATATVKAMTAEDLKR